MKRHVWVYFICLFGMLCVLTASVPAYSQEVIKLTYASFFPPVHKCSILSEQWCKEVEKRTNGKVEVSYLPGGTLLKGGPPSYEGVVRGIADIGMSSQQWLAGRFPLTEAMYLPLGVTTGTQATNMITAWYKKFRPKEYDDTKILYLHCSPPGVVMTLKPLPSISDLKGVKIRAAGSTTPIVEALGGVPVSVPIGDIYEGLQRGMIQGVIMPAESLKGWRFGDLIRGMQDNPGLGYPSALCVVMNKNKWESLPRDVQAIIDQVNEEWIAKQGAVWDEITKEGIDYAVSKGMKVAKISEKEVAITREKMKPLLDDYVKRMKEKGLPGEESLEFCKDFIKANP